MGQGWEGGSELGNHAEPLTFTLMRTPIIGEISQPETGLSGQTGEQSGHSFVLPSL